MIPQATAVRFVDELRIAGRTSPVLVDAELNGGAIEQVVLKLTGPKLDSLGLLHEVATAAIASHFGLPVPAPYLVDIPEQLFLDGGCPTNVANRFAGALTPTFGCTYLPGLFAYGGGKRLPLHLLPVALRAFVLDALTVNRDRGDGGNPNCLTNGNKLFLIDHEQALDCDAIGSHFSVEPWKIGSLDQMGDGLMRHIFFEDLRGVAHDFTELEDAWADLPLQSIDEVTFNVPIEWDPGRRRARQIHSYLAELLQNLPAAFNEIQKVLS